MNNEQSNIALRKAATIAAVLSVWCWIDVMPAPAGEGSGNTEQSKIETGLEIALVPLNLKGKDRNLVGLGSYLVNAVADCNGLTCALGAEAARERTHSLKGVPSLSEETPIRVHGGSGYFKVALAALLKAPKSEIIRSMQYDP